MKLNQHFRDLLETVGQSEANRYNYTRRLQSFLDQHGERKLEEISQADINNWLAMLRDRGYAETTLTGYRQAIKTLFNAAVNQNRLTASPARHIKTGSTISRRPKLPPEHAVTAITHQALIWLKSNNPYQVRTAAFWLLSRAAGPRWGELHNLKQSDIAAAIQAGQTFVKSFGKTGEVVLRFDHQVANALREWLRLRPPAKIDRCFITTRPSPTKTDKTPRYRPLSRSGATKALIALAAAAGIEKAILTHALRHRLGDTLTHRKSAKYAAIALNHRDWQTAKTAIAYYHHPEERAVAAAIAELAEIEELTQWATFFRVTGTE